MSTKRQKKEKKEKREKRKETVSEKEQEPGKWFIVAAAGFLLMIAGGYKVGLISTVCNYIDDRPVPTEHTTPDPITLNRLLGEMADSGCKYAFMEVSSHSIAQQRISGLKFAGGIFTNLTRDHLDYHKTV